MHVVNYKLSLTVFAQLWYFGKSQKSEIKIPKFYYVPVTHFMILDKLPGLQIPPFQLGVIEKLSDARIS